MKTIYKYLTVLAGVVVLFIIGCFLSYRHGKSVAEEEYNKKIADIEAQQKVINNEIRDSATKANYEVKTASIVLDNKIKDKINEVKKLPASSCTPDDARMQLIQGAYRDTNSAISGN